MNTQSFIIQGNIVDVTNKRIFCGELNIQNGKISFIRETPQSTSENYILPGFIDSHVHIESSMIIPSESVLLYPLQILVGTAVIMLISRLLFMKRQN